MTDLLYHGSVADFADSIREHGLIPRRGAPGSYLTTCAGCAREHAVLAACAHHYATRMGGSGLIVTVEAPRSSLASDPNHDDGLIARRGIPAAAIRELRTVRIDPALLGDIDYCEWVAKLFEYTKVANAGDRAAAEALWPEIRPGAERFDGLNLIRNLDAHVCERVRGRAA